MKHFTSLADVEGPRQLVRLALEIHQNPSLISQQGQDKTLALIFLSPSLRTRMSSQLAAQKMGMHVLMMNQSQDSWKLEFEKGVVMDGDRAEHIQEAAAVIGQYCDIIGIRAFAGLKDREKDYQEEIIKAFQRYSGVPIISLESATRHPLQSLADWITIEQFKKKERPKVVLSWAPHPRALPQAVANSFLEWMKIAPVDLLLTHPEGYELSPAFSQDVPVEYDQAKALKGADFVYVKNWSSYERYGQILSTDPSWMIDPKKMALTQEAYLMHCLPVRRNVVIQDHVLDSPASLVVPQARNRVLSAQTVLFSLLKTLA